MANIKSQIKRNRQNERRRMRNKVARSELKTRVKRAAEGLETGAEDAGDRVRAAQRRLGKAAEKGVALDTFEQSLRHEGRPVFA